MRIAHLPDCNLDIVGDVHGEKEALDNLLQLLGYDDQGRHPEHRKLVFIGDLCDRGPDSVGVIRLVRGMVENGTAFAILGNHELNLLRDERKDGNDWFWSEGTRRDQKYSPFVAALPEERDEIRSFLRSLPLALEREDLRVVHAAWHAPSIEVARRLDEEAQLPDLFAQWEDELRQSDRYRQIAAQCERELEQWGPSLDDSSVEPPLLAGIGLRDELHQLGNPLRVLTSGIERLGSEPFFSSGKWRFAERVRWWDEYGDSTPVVIGHYWRRLQPVDRTAFGKGDPDLFSGYEPTAWHGERRNVFCVDYSVGGRYQERRAGSAPGTATKLAALRWPEQQIVLDTGERIRTE